MQDYNSIVVKNSKRLLIPGLHMPGKTRAVNKDQLIVSPCHPRQFRCEEEAASCGHVMKGSLHARKAERGVKNFSFL